MAITRKQRILLYVLSSFMDMVAGTLLFIVPVRAAQLGASYSLAGALGVAWGLGAAVMVVIGRYVTQKNSAKICIVSCALQAALHLTLILFVESPVVMLPFMFCLGLTHTAFYVPYQVFFKTAESSGNLPLSVSVGIYTFAWSMGMAVGPLWSGFLIQETLGPLAGWQLCFVFTILSLVFVGSSIVHIKRHAVGHTVDEDQVAEDERPDFAKIAWLSALCGAFAFSLIRGLFPAGAVRIGVSESVQGGVLFTMGLMQALSALFLGRILNWMYRPRVLAIVALLGVGGMACFLLGFLGMFQGTWLLILFFGGAFIFGLYSGSFYFYTVFHCLVHPSRAGANVAMNECMFSTANVVGLLLGGVIADMYGINIPYLGAGILIIFFTAVQIKYHVKYPWPFTRAPKAETA